MERQLISMKVQYQSLQKMHAFSKQQMQRMKVQCVPEDSWGRGTRPCPGLTMLTCLAGPDSHPDAAAGLQGRPGPAGEAAVHAGGEERGDPESDDQTPATGEDGGEFLLSLQQNTASSLPGPQTQSNQIAVTCENEKSIVIVLIRFNTLNH